MLLAGLRKILGKHVFQKGSNITAERLRFDFSQDDKMTEEQLQQVEDFVNYAISTNFDVSMIEMPKQAALDMGVVGSFWEKYPDIVKVYTMAKGDEIFSIELCGGPHVANSSGL